MVGALNHVRLKKTCGHIETFKTCEISALLRIQIQLKPCCVHFLKMKLLFLFIVPKAGVKVHFLHCSTIDLYRFSRLLYVCTCGTRVHLERQKANSMKCGAACQRGSSLDISAVQDISPEICLLLVHSSKLEFFPLLDVFPSVNTDTVFLRLQ